MKTCSLCKEVRSSKDFNYKNKTKGVLSPHCKTCTRAYLKAHYNTNRDYYLRKAKLRNLQVRNKVKEYIWSYLSTHACIDCGEKDPVVLEFDHMSNKTSDVASLVYSNSFEKVVREISKCEVRCANCHRRKTALEGSWYKTTKAPVA